MTTVVKLGGSLLEDAARRIAVLRGIATRWLRGEEIVLVHGGGKHIDAELAKAGIPKRTHAGLRITDDATLQIVVRVLAGTVNRMLVEELNALGVRAEGISGTHSETLVAERHPAVDGVDLGNVGVVRHSSPMVSAAMVARGILPVISSVAQGTDGALYNVNADSAAAAIAAAHQARELLFLTDVDGVMDEEGTVIRALDAAGVEAMLDSPAVTGGMRPKLQAALAALEGGVMRVAIGPGAGAGGTLLQSSLLTHPASSHLLPREAGEEELAITIPATTRTPSASSRSPLAGRG